MYKNKLQGYILQLRKYRKHIGSNSYKWNITFKIVNHYTVYL